MPSVFNDIQCPKCFTSYQIERNQEWVFCGKVCGDYFNRFKDVVGFEDFARRGLSVSSHPIYDGVTAFVEAFNKKPN